MTKESVELLTEIFNNHLWDDYSDPVDKCPALKKIDDSISHLFRCDPALFAVLVKQFDSREEAKEYQSKVDELLGIRIAQTLEIGGTKMTWDSLLFGAFNILDNCLLIEIDRFAAKALGEETFMYHGYRGRLTLAGFLTYFGRNNGKHWNDLLQSIKD